MNEIDVKKKRKRSLSSEAKDKEEKAEEGSFSGSSSSSKITTKSHYSKTKKTEEEEKKWSPNLSSLPAEVLDHLALFLDTDSSLALMSTCKILHDKMVSSERFWRQMCRKEEFDKINEILMREYEEEDAVDQTRSVARMSDLRHDDDISSVLPASRKLFLRGVQMRRNVCQGRFKRFRVDFPLRTLHEAQYFTSDDDFSFFHNDDFLVVFLGEARSVFVWKWDRFRNPTFLYSRDDLWQTELFPDMRMDSRSLFLHGRYLVVAPIRGPDLIRVHDLSDSGLTKMGAFECLDEGQKQSQDNRNIEHFHKVGGGGGDEEAKAMIFYRSAKETPLMLFVFSLPNCELLVEMEVPGSLRVRSPYKFAERGNKMAFCFVPSEHQDIRGKKMLLVDFEEFVKGRGPVAMAMGSEIGRGDEVFTYGILDGNRIVLLHKSGKVTVLRMDLYDGSHVELLVIPSLGKRCEWERLLTASNGRNMFALTRHFSRGGLKVFVYSVITGDLIYFRRLGEKRFGLEFRKFGVEDIHVSMDDNFLVVTNAGTVAAFFHAKSGKFIKSLSLREEEEEPSGQFLLRKHLAFEFAGHGLVSFSAPKVAREDVEHERASADIMLFI